MIDKLPESIIEKCALFFTRKFSWIPILSALFLFFLFAIHNINLINDKRFLAIFSVLMALGSYYVLRQIICPPLFGNKDQIGFLLAIRTESKDAHNRLNIDLKDAIVRSLSTIDTTATFNVQVLQSFHANNVSDRDIATYYARKTKARFVLFGSLVERRVRGEEHFVLQIQALVTHGTTTIENQTILSSEMSAVLPLRANITSKNELEGFELTGHLFGFGSQYIVSIALFLSGDQATAITALTDLNKKLQSSQIAGEWPGSKALKALVPIRLLDFQHITINHEYFKWRNDHATNRLQLIEQYFSALPEEWKKDWRYLNIRAITHFVLYNNVNAARELIRKVGSISPNCIVWRYSLAFLDAYEGNTVSARAGYLRAFKYDLSSETAIEVEEFLNWIVSKHIEKSQLVFFLGFLNFHMKKDYLSASNEFQLFLHSPNSILFPELVAEAKGLLAKCVSLQTDQSRSELL